MKARLWAGRLALLAVATAGSLLAAEGFFRLRSPAGAAFVAAPWPTRHPGDLFRDQPYRSLSPNAEEVFATTEYHTTIRTNRHGLRGPELVDKQADTLRVLALGDSFTLAVQVEEAETLAGRLEGELGAALGRDVQVLNAGVSGIGTTDATAALEHLGRRLQIDAALLNFYLGNDLRDNERAAERRRGAPQTMPVLAPVSPTQARLQDLAKGLTRQSFLLTHLASQWALRTAMDDPHLLEHAEEMAVFADPELLRRQSSRTRTALEQFAGTCSRLQIRCAVSLIPPAYAVDTDRTDASFRAMGLDPSRVDLDVVAETVAGMVPASVPVYDLSPRLRDAQARGEDLYFTYDPHWTASAHAEAAAALSPWLAELWTDHGGARGGTGP